MIAEFITALPTIISLLERGATDSPPLQAQPPSPITDALIPKPIVEPFVPTPSIIPVLAEFEYKPIEFDPWWLKTEYKGIEPIPVPPKKKDCNPYWENCMLKV